MVKRTVVGQVQVVGPDGTDVQQRVLQRTARAGGMRHDVPSRPDPKLDRALFDVQLGRIQRTEVNRYGQRLAGNARCEQPIRGHLGPPRVAETAFDAPSAFAAVNHERACDARNLDRYSDPQCLLGRPTQLDQRRGADFRRAQRPDTVGILGRDPHIVQVPIRFQDEIAAEVRARSVADRLMPKRHGS